MGRVYVFADEAGNFDFRRADGATRYFILGTITTRDAAAGEALLGLRRELAWNLEDLTWYGPHPPDCYSSGTRLRATHLFTTSDLFGYYA
jgi:hypothetical protein